MSPTVASPQATISLTQLPAARFGIIRQIASDQIDAERLAGLGLCPGRRVEIIKPGDPMILRVYGVHVGLSARLSRHIQVEMLPLPDTVELSPAYVTT